MINAIYHPVGHSHLFFKREYGLYVFHDYKDTIGLNYFDFQPMKAIFGITCEKIIMLI
jgi:hypothetical protein